jgi:DNA-3-methyladenine glycosylase
MQPDMHSVDRRNAIDGKEIGRIGKSVRIGITRDADRLLRFYDHGNAHVSGVKKLRQ